MSQFETPSTCAPPVPETLEACGVPAPVLEDLLLKHLHLPGMATIEQLASQIRLPNSIIESLAQSLSSSEYAVLDSASQRVAMTVTGRRRACDAFAISRYLGPAPVSQTQYQDQCRAQRWDGAGITADDLQAALSGVSLTEETSAELQLAIALGGSLLLTGRSGNGKSLVADRLGQMLVQSSEEIYVPYAIWLTDGILRIFDPQVHHPVDESDVAAESDTRWRRIRRPVIKTSYELTRQSFDVAGLPSETWLAPFHVRANGGMLIVDDLGRQPVPLVDLLNRWQNALEFQSDPVTLPTGRRLNLPVDAWIVFVVGDDAPALPVPARRRIRSQVELPDPDRERFSTLLLEQGRRSRIEVDEAGVEELFTHCYSPQNPPKCSDPENLLQTVESLCRIQKETVRARADLLLAAARRLGLDRERRAA